MMNSIQDKLYPRRKSISEKDLKEEKERK